MGQKGLGLQLRPVSPVPDERVSFSDLSASSARCLAGGPGFEVWARLCTDQPSPEPGSLSGVRWKMVSGGVVVLKP